MNLCAKYENNIYMERVLSDLSNSNVFGVY